MSSFSSVRHARLRRAAARTIRRAKRAKLTIATAESCTAGQLAALLAAQPSAAGVFQGGAVVYSKSAKTAALGVSRPLLARHSAVSAEVARAMARGAARRLRADLAVAITGVAGPSRDEDGNPVGLVFVAVSKSRLSLCRGRQLPARDPSRNLTAMHLLALELLDEAIGGFSQARHGSRKKGPARRAARRAPSRGETSSSYM